MVTNTWKLAIDVIDCTLDLLCPDLFIFTIHLQVVFKV